MNTQSKCEKDTTEDDTFRRLRRSSYEELLNALNKHFINDWPSTQLGREIIIQQHGWSS